MAQSKNNVVTHGLSGKVDLLVFSQRNGKTIVSKSPRKPGTVSPSQQQVQASFQQAVIYAKAATADPVTKENYKAKAPVGNSAYNVAIADFFNAPDITEVDLSAYTGAPGSSIKIAVNDDFKVASVSVKIENPDGSLVEQGNAVAQPDGLHWIFSATQNNSSLSGDKITVLASDLPGNQSTDERTLS